MRILTAIPLALTTACSPDVGSPHYFYYDATFDPVVSPLGLVYGAHPDQGQGTSLAVSTLHAADPLGVTVTGGSTTAPSVGPDGFVLDCAGNSLDVYTDRLSPWMSLPVPGDCSDFIPTIDADGTTYVADRSGFVSSWDIHGDPLWQVDIGGAFFGRGSLDGEGRLLLLHDKPDGQTSGYLALDAATGAVLWDVEQTTPWSPLHPHKDSVYSVAYLGDPDDPNRDIDAYRLQARSLEDGSLLWEINPGLFALAPSITGSGDLIVVMNTLDTSSAAVARLDGKDGTERWRVTDDSYYGRPTLLSNGDFMLGCSGDMCQMKASSGALVRRFDVGGYSPAFAGAAMDGVIVADSVGVYVGWDVGGNLRTATDGWPRYGGGNHGAGRVP